MAIEYINDLDHLIEIVERNQVVSYPNSGEGVIFLEWLRQTGRLNNILCVTQRVAAPLNKFLRGIPVIHLDNIPYLKNSATFIISGADKNYAEMNKALVDFGCSKVYCLHANVRKAIKDELHELDVSGVILNSIMKNLDEKMNALNHLLEKQNEICKLNTTAFEPYRNCYRGKKVVIVGNGETARYYTPSPDAIHIAADGARPIDGVVFDFQFVRPPVEGSSMATFIDKILDKELPIVVSNGALDQIVYQDICCHPLSIFSGGSLTEALHFALFTFPDEIQLVGCDLTSEDQNISSLQLGFTRLKSLTAKYYPQTRIISVNPIGLKGIFSDSYTESYEMAVERQAMLDSESDEIIALNQKRFERVRQCITENAFDEAFNNLSSTMSDTPKENLPRYKEELISVWQLALQKTSLENKSLEQRKFEGALLTLLENMIKLPTAPEYPPSNFANENVTERLNNFAINGVRQAAARKHMGEATRFAELVEQLAQPLNPNDNVLMAETFHNNARHEKAPEFLLRAAGVEKFSKVLVSDTVLTTLLYMLLFEDWRDTCFVCGNWLNRALINKLLACGVPGFYSKNFFQGVDSDKIAINRLATYVKENKIPVYGHDHLPGLSEPFINESFSVIEDGLGNYRETPMKSTRVVNGRRYLTLGYDKTIKRVYLTGRKPVPELLKDKAVVFDMTECWQRRTPEEQKIIADIFSVPMERLLELFDQGRNQILLTQPMQETFGGDINERKRKVLEFYKKVLARYDKSRVFIKTHPRDSINYAGLIPDCPVVTERFPLEFLKLLGVSDRIDKLISVRCTANFGIVDDSKVDEYFNEWTTFVKTGEL